MLKLLGALGGWQGYAAIAVACLLAGSFGTWRVMSWREQAHQTQVLIKTVKQIEYRDRISHDVETKYITVVQKVRDNSARQIEDIPTHVTPQADADCPVPLGFVRVFNAATGGSVPDAASGPDGAPSGVALSEVAKASVENAGEYDATSAQLTALQDWVRQQQAVKP